MTCCMPLTKVSVAWQSLCTKTTIVVACLALVPRISFVREYIQPAHPNHHQPHQWPQRPPPTPPTHQSTSPPSPVIFPSTSAPDHPCKFAVSDHRPPTSSLKTVFSPKINGRIHPPTPTPPH